MSALAYRTIQENTEAPRQTEYRLFAEITRDLIAAEKASDDRMMKIKAIDRNRRLWLALRHDCVTEQNALPDTIRAGIISLSLWVDRHSRQVMQNKMTFESLISVNRTIMAGLQAQPNSG